ncbi:Ff.00g134790.m01.CDS01 [Fusarium sp. VM40]|nr:Ff.00g134790.m01.CDS01 [Fusarium sp. VM40]
METLPIKEAKAKRTRTNVKQSKNGCLTCKARRIKCDEAKPTCQRCISSKRECGGYPRDIVQNSSLKALSSSSSSPSSSDSLSGLSIISSASTPMITLAFTPQQLSSPFVALACNVLVSSPRRARTDIEQNLWSHIVPQLAHSIPSVRAAVEAFGSSYNEYVLKVDTPCPGLETTKRYAQALRLVQYDLATLQYGPLPAIVACLFLACAEALQQRLNKSHLHLLGAFSLLLSGAGSKALATIDIESVSFLFQKLDLHVATYGVCNPPHFPPLSPIMTDSIISLPPDRSLYKILHSCYHFTARAHQYKYTNRRIMPPELLIEQGRQIGTMKQWLSCNTVSLPYDVESDESLLVLRTQCLAALIHASTILDPRETSYDFYGPDFEEIVTTIEVLLMRKHSQQDSQHDSLPSFIPEMGILHPLYLTAKKYRNSYWRRKALQLIRKCGREGPWCAETESSIVEAVIKTEEGLPDKASLDLSQNEDATTHNPSNIPEKDRINCSWTIDPGKEDGDCTVVTRKRYTSAVMFQCMDIDGMLHDSEGQQPREFPWVDSKWWKTWIVSLE